MSRIRTIKPEFFRHEQLQDMQIARPELNPMLVFIGLWTIADREGRFEWRPKIIGLDVLPFLEFSVSESMDFLCEYELIEKFEIEGKLYGQIASWNRHQIPSRDEPPSEIPASSGQLTPYFRPLTQTERFKVYERDGWVCVYCGRDLSRDHRAACLDHVIPYSKGGTNRAKNLATSCKKCNSTKLDKTPLEVGYRWPKGLGEHVNDTVNPPLTGGLSVADKEREREGEKEREREKEREWEKENSAEQKTLDADASPPVIFLPLNDGGDHGISENDASELLTLYPSVNVMQELRNMRGWLLGNPKQRKTKRGVMSFVHRWLSKAQDRGGRGLSPQQQKHMTIAEKNSAFLRQCEEEIAAFEAEKNNGSVIDGVEYARI